MWGSWGSFLVEARRNQLTEHILLIQDHEELALATPHAQNVVCNFEVVLVCSAQQLLPKPAWRPTGTLLLHRRQKSPVSSVWNSVMYR